MWWQVRGDRPSAYFRASIASTCAGVSRSRWMCPRAGIRCLRVIHIVGRESGGPHGRSRRRQPSAEELADCRRLPGLQRAHAMLLQRLAQLVDYLALSATVDGLAGAAAVLPAKVNPGGPTAIGSPGDRALAALASIGHRHLRAACQPMPCRRVS